MKRIIVLFVFLFLALGSNFNNQVFAAQSPVAFSIEEIEKFDSKIIINQDTSLSITETIDYFTPVEKHGIYRYVPEKYKKNGFVDSHKISDISVTDKEGSPIQFEIIRENGNVTMKIGDPNITFSGLRTYVVSYKIDNAVLRQDGFDELYWDITGEGWKFPIQRSMVTIASPYAKTREVRCFTGPIGGIEKNCVSSTTTNVFVFTNKSVSYGENFTVAIKLDKNNSLVFPTKFENILRFVKNNYFLILLFMPGLIMFFFWYKKGRDFRFDSPNAFNMDPDQPQRLRPLFEPINTPMVYEPFKDLTPGEAGTLLDEKVDNQDVVSEIIDLARKKYLKIERVENKGFLKFGHDYTFTKLKEEKGLDKHQLYLFKNIFKSGQSVKLSSLKGSFYTHMSKVKEMINEDLKSKKIFTGNPNSARVAWLVLATLLCTLMFFVSIGNIVFLGEFWPVGVFIVSVVTSIIFAWNMPQKTALGTNYALQVKGLRETIRLGKWREEVKEKNLFIEEVLPFAMSLGVISKLAKDMAALNIQPPKYMSGGFGSNPIAWSGFVSDFSSTASSGLSYNPSSSGSGGSGFSGGSSGGGGGGGGGGSW